MRRKNTTTKPQDTLSSKINAELARREAKELPKSFKAFVRAAWDIVEPGSPLLDGMHIDAMCDHLQAAAERRISQLIITVPPRHTKSTLVSVLFNAWVWTWSPAERFLYASYSSTLAIRDAVKCRRIVESDWYRSRWPHVQIEEDQNLKSSYELTTRGGRQTTSVSGTVTGLGGSFLIVDDPHNVADAESTAVREQAVEWFRESFYNRTTTRDTVRIVVQQRVHERDVAGYCIGQDDWVHLNLPMEYAGDSEPNAFGWSDPRTKFGELLWPARYSEKELGSIKKTLGSYAYAGQYQQTPTPRGGGMFKKEWLRFWYDPTVMVEPAPVTAQDKDGDHFDLPQIAWIPNGRVPVVASWDMAFKATSDSDFVVGQAWCRPNPADFYLIDQVRGRLDFPKSLAAVRALTEKHQALPTLIEGKANGPAVISALAGEVMGMVEINPEGGKEARAAAVSPLFEAGNVWLPHPTMCPWVTELIAELTMFPRAEHDDQVDALTQALVHMRERRTYLVDFGLNAGSGGGGSDSGLETESYWLLQ